jgi:transketolase
LVEASRRPEFVFLTGDLGYKALEPLREALGPRFINAGVAEQNMVSVAAGLARSGMRPWVYSIAPFVYARPYEQIRNDVCFHRLPVVLVGNGGGYGYGVMGASHHALEDYGALLCLPHMQAFIPAFEQDVAQQVKRLFSVSHPAYLRLGASEEPSGAEIPAYSSWRRLQEGPGWMILVTGPLVGGIWSRVRAITGAGRPTVWVVTELPCRPVPAEFLDDLHRASGLLLVEEHVEQGGVAQNLALALLASGKLPARFAARCARGYPSGRYGSQAFHRRECGLDAESIVDFLAFEGDRDAA